MTQKQIKESLLNQLELKGKNIDFYEDLVSDYVEHWKIKKKLIADINKKGVRYTAINGNGIEIERANESVANLQKTTATMLKILSELGLKEPVRAETDNDYC